MKSLRNAGAQPFGLPILADQIVEFHAARILLLIRICGARDRIEGLTKLAKLDFFVRYPGFFALVTGETHGDADGHPAVESVMVRHHYGPWDKRYYHLLAYLVSTGLIRVTRGQGRMFVFELTGAGHVATEQLLATQPFGALVAHMKAVRSRLGSRSGTALKELIYKALEDEVAQRPLGERIE